MSLSDTQLRAINGKPYLGKPELADRDGLSVRITPAGTITWQYRFRIDNQPGRLTLGRYPDLKLADARKLIPELRNSVANNIDPRVFWKQRNTFAGQTTLRDCCEQFLSARSAALKPGTVATYQSCFRAHLYDAFADRKVESITLGEWIDFFDKKAIHSRVTAGAILKQLKTVLSWSVRRQMISLIDVLQLRVSDVGSAPKVGSRVLTILECGKIIRELDKCRATKAVTNAIKACLLTGARISEILKSKRADFDLESMIWTVPINNSKTNLPIRRPISPALLDILQEQWNLYHSPWSFPAANDLKRPGNIASVNKLVREIKPRLEIPDWRIHDFRRTLSTRMSEAGVLPHVTEKMLGHLLGGVMAVYNKHDWLDDQAVAYEQWTNKLKLAALGDSKIVVLERRA
ncbi:site-specific integrase [Shewanella baltica]|uniref:tyrosine-type recombinase/integrase n=1 Tax=Shewanella baltica TaxID=62322 RepID=UPI0030CB9002